MEAKKLKEKLFKSRINAWENVNTDEKEKIFRFSKEYTDFINKNKTERECVNSIKEILEKNNFIEINTKEELMPGDKVYFINRKKTIYASIIGKENIEKGLNIIGAHIDSPRLDLKPNPIYEDTELAMFKTHYYGGIKTYQWVNIPLSMHGIIVKKKGTIEVKIGENPNDPIFTIADLLPHLSKNQEKKTLKDGIEGEDLNILIGSIPYSGDIDEKVKLNILNILFEKYGITEQDFISAEIEFTPAMKARDLGFDRSMIAGYGQDDRVCAYTSLKALLNSKSKKTTVLILADKEEIGSMGNTGMYSHTFEYFIEQLLEKTGNKETSLNKIFNNTKLLSADVTGAYNPNHPEIYEKNNETFLNHGVSIIKYTGSASKGGASDANAEFVGYVRNLFERNKIPYQISEMGKIGVGGGGTIAYILADRGIEVLDCGVPVLSMHSPYEITSKMDIYSAYKAYKVFYEDD
ncbi:MAG: aminopeptidase [Bacilli bacterium]|nr:aminopeptidase [Bacilli bacterium]MBR3209016.1 aminopeptidase [Bacilli bacterium]